MRTNTVRNATLVIVPMLCLISPSQGEDRPADNATQGFVYIATNQPGGNHIIQFNRKSDGSLIRMGEPVSTGGNGGTGNGVGPLDPLGSQDSLVLTNAGSLIIVVNAGSNSLSTLRAGNSGVSLISVVSSNGVFPNSVAIREDLVYVLNAHGTPNISGYRLTSSGTLVAISGSARNLPGAASAKPHDIRFSPDGDRLLVTDEGNRQIDVFDLNDSGIVTGMSTNPSAGSGPFGFNFARNNELVVTEANTGSASSYRLTALNALQVLSPVVADGQAATCWISFTASKRLGFASNTGSGDLSVYRVTDNGTLNLVDPIAASIPGSAPIDSAFSDDGRFLYVDDSAMGRILEFEAHEASLLFLGAVTGLPQTIQGIGAQ